MHYSIINRIIGVSIPIFNGWLFRSQPPFLATWDDSHAFHADGSGLRPLENLPSFRKNPRRWTLKWLRKKNNAKHCRTIQTMPGWCLGTSPKGEDSWCLIRGCIVHVNGWTTSLVHDWNATVWFPMFLGCWTPGLMQIQRILWLRLLGC